MVRKILHLQINLVLWLFFSSNFSLFYGEIELRNFGARVSPPVSRFSSIEVSGSLLIDISWIFFSVVLLTICVQILQQCFQSKRQFIAPFLIFLVLRITILFQANYYTLASATSVKVCDEELFYFSRKCFSRSF